MWVCSQQSMHQRIVYIIIVIAFKWRGKGTYRNSSIDKSLLNPSSGMPQWSLEIPMEKYTYTLRQGARLFNLYGSSCYDIDATPCVTIRNLKNTKKFSADLYSTYYICDVMWRMCLVPTNLCVWCSERNDGAYFADRKLPYAEKISEFDAHCDLYASSFLPSHHSKTFYLSGSY